MPTFVIHRSAFERLPVRRVEVRVHPRASALRPAEPELHVFEPGAPGAPDTLSWTPARPEAVESYRLRTVFEDDRPPYESPSIPVPEGVGPSEPTEPIELVDLGARVFDGHALPYRTITAVEGSFVDVSGHPRSFRLTRDAPLFVVFAGEDYPDGEPIAYDLDYRLTGGNYRETRLSAATMLIPVADPLVRKTVTFDGVGLEPESADHPVQLVQLTVGHLEDGVDWRVEGEAGDVTLSPDRPSHSFTFDVVDPTRALTRYQGTTIFSDGRQQRIPETLIPETAIRVGDAPAWWTVEVDPGLVDWHSYRVVQVEMRALNAVGTAEAAGARSGDADAAGEPETLLFFWQGVPSRYWSFQVPLGRSGSFTWRALYVRADGVFGWTAERTETSHQATLPTRLPSAETSTPAGPRRQAPDWRAPG